jgi:hypothetical protein
MSNIIDDLIVEEKYWTVNHWDLPGFMIYDLRFPINYYFGNKRAEFPSFRRKPESIKKTGCRIKSGMTNFEVFTCRCNICDLRITIHDF